MIDINLIRTETQKVKDGIAKKGYDAFLVDEVLKLDQERVGLIQKVEEIRARRNKLAEGGRPSDAEAMEGKELKVELKELEPKLDEVGSNYLEALNKIPNLPADDVPEGKDESENKVVRSWGEPTKLDFQPKDHMELGETLGIVDTETAANVTGTRFGYLKGDAALLEFALVNFALGILTNSEKLAVIAEKAGVVNKPFIPVVPPVMIRPEVFKRMARLSDADRDERYYLQQDDLYLIGSAEHTLGPIHMDQTLNEKDLPLRYVGFSTSFRREAGSYGQDTKGIIRVHQFDKLEMESFTVAENSVKEQDFIVSIQEHLLQQLQIPYQVVAICTGDMGAPDARQIDIECWIPSQNKYRETHTSDMMTDYQARRLNTKVSRKNGTEYVHMNDATAFAVGRTIVAILENNQQEDGSVIIPEVLRSYMGKDKITKS